MLCVIPPRRALESLVDERLVRAIGFSNASLAQIEDMLATAKHKPAVNQIELHPLLAQRKMVGVCARKGVVCVAHSSLGRKSSGELLNDAAVQQIAQETGKTVTQVGLVAGGCNVQENMTVLTLLDDFLCASHPALQSSEESMMLALLKRPKLCSW